MSEIPNSKKSVLYLDFIGSDDLAAPIISRKGHFKPNRKSMNFRFVAAMRLLDYSHEINSFVKENFNC